ncbi:hypothetical protein ACFL96_19065 [Thermoproteota archaeon]
MINTKPIETFLHSYSGDYVETEFHDENSATIILDCDVVKKFTQQFFLNLFDRLKSNKLVFDGIRWQEHGLYIDISNEVTK